MTQGSRCLTVVARWRGIGSLMLQMCLGRPFVGQRCSAAATAAMLEAPAQDVCSLRARGARLVVVAAVQCRRATRLA